MRPRTPAPRARDPVRGAGDRRRDPARDHPGYRGRPHAPTGYLSGVREIADRYGILLILDEVMAGFGPQGHWLALDAYEVRPDLVAFAKGVNSGYVPVGGVMISDPIAAAFDDRVFPGGLTYSGHPLAAASIVANLTAMADEGAVDNAQLIGGSTSGPGCARSPSGTGSSARSAALACSGRSSWCPTGPPGHRCPRRNDGVGSGPVSWPPRPAAVPPTENRLHVVPPDRWSLRTRRPAGAWRPDRRRRSAALDRLTGRRGPRAVSSSRRRHTSARARIERG